MTSLSILRDEGSLADRNRDVRVAVVAAVAACVFAVSLATVSAVPLLAGSSGRRLRVLFTVVAVGAFAGGAAFAFARWRLRTPAAVAGIAFAALAVVTVLEPRPASLVLSSLVVVRPRPVALRFVAALPVLCLLAGFLGIGEAWHRGLVSASSRRAAVVAGGTVALVVVATLFAAGVWRSDLGGGVVLGLVGTGLVAGFALVGLLHYGLRVPIVAVVAWVALLAVGVVVATAGDPVRGAVTAWVFPAAAVVLGWLVEGSARRIARWLAS